MKIDWQAINLMRRFLQKRFQIAFQENGFTHSRTSIQHDLQPVDLQQILINDSWSREDLFKKALAMGDRIDIKQSPRNKCFISFTLGQHFIQPVGNFFQLVFPVSLNDPVNGIF